MNDPLHRPEPDLQALRRIIVGPAIERLDRFEAGTGDPEVRAQVLSSDLPRAIALSTRANDQFARAITPAVEDALERSVKRDPAVLVEAIFPVLGPAIRKAITERFNQLILSLNQTLTHGFSWQGLKWRWEAFRTGKSFGEVVLFHTLVYRVEQVFLIHKQTSLLLQHVRAPSITGQDGDMVSGMLSAIQDFVQQSFDTAKGEQLETLKVGDLNVWIESGPQATLAVVIRGQAPSELRLLMQESLERLHRDFAVALEKFSGDTSVFDAAQPLLERCLQTKLAEHAQESYLRAWLFLSLLLVFLLVACIPVWREERRWNHYVEGLRQENGFVVAEASRHWRKFHISGLRDPLAEDPADLLLKAGVNPRHVVSRWEPCESIQPQFVVQRARARLAVPAGVLLQFQAGVLYAVGRAPAGWASTVRSVAESLPGVTEFNVEGLQPESPPSAGSLRNELESYSLFFAGTEVVPQPGQEDILRVVRDRILELEKLASTQGLRAQVRVLGHVPNRPGGTRDGGLSLTRAMNIGHWLTEHGVDAGLLTPEGVGIQQPIREGTSEQDQAQNRRVSFRVTLNPAAVAVVK